MIKQTEKWINLIKSETQIEPDSAFYELIQHKTDFFLDGVLQFSACELIIEVYSDEEFEEFEHNIYPNLISGDTRIINGNLDSRDFETFIITNTPKYDEQELTNGLSRLASGNHSDIANEIVKLKSYDWNNLLPIDKKDFTYFNNVRSYVSFEQLYQNEDESVNQICSNIIGLEVYLYEEILKIDTSIKQKVNFENYVTQQYFIERGCDKIDLSFISEPIKIIKGVNFYEFSNSQNNLIESLAKKNNLESDDIKGYLSLKDFKLPTLDDFVDENFKSIEIIQNYLQIIYKHSYVLFEAVFYKLMSYNTCIWNEYPNILTKNITLKNLIDESKKYNPERFTVKIFNDYKEFQKKRVTNKFLFKDVFLLERKYQNLEEDLKSYLNYEFESENCFKDAIIHYENENWKKAIIDFDKCIEHNPNRLDAYYNRALAKYEIDDFKGAENDLNRGLKIKKNAECYYMLGLIHGNKFNDPEKAMEFYSLSINIDSGYFDSLINRGQIYLDKKLYSEALEDFNSVIKYEKYNFNAIFGRAVTLFEMKRYDESLNDFNLIKSKEPENDFTDRFINEINDLIRSEEINSKEYSEFQELLKKANIYIERHFELIEIDVTNQILSQREIRIYSIINDLNKLIKKFKNLKLKKEIEFEVSKIYYSIGEIKILLFEKNNSNNNDLKIALMCFEHSASLKNEKAIKALNKYNLN